MNGISLFALRASGDLGQGVASILGVPLSRPEERDFEDGEHKIRSVDPVRGSDVYVVQSLHGGGAESANDKLVKLLFFVGSLKDAGAARVTAVTPYLCYARKDRRTKANDPVAIRYVAGLFESVGTDAIVTVDVHNPAAFENAFRCRTIAATAAPLFAGYARALADRPLCVVSPDAGGAKRAELLRELLESDTGRQVANAIAEKHRSSGVVSGDLFAGEVAGTRALIVDDLISTGTTLLRTAKSARRAGATSVLALVTHGLFMRGSDEVLCAPAIDRLIVTDSVPVAHLSAPALAKTDVLSVAPLLADIVRRLHDDRSLNDLLIF
jgi:ribose-phosphate pyrophosphokinase